MGGAGGITSDDVMYYIGGMSQFAYNTDVWKSVNYGVTWTQVVSSAEFGSRSGHCVLIDSNDYIYLIAGYPGNAVYYASKDVWKSTNGGVSWTRIFYAEESDTTTFSSRHGHACVIDSYDNMYIIGGEYKAGLGHSALNDVWKSTDYGVTWTSLSTSPTFTGRGSLGSVIDSRGNFYVFDGVSYTTSVSGVYASYANTPTAQPSTATPTYIPTAAPSKVPTAIPTAVPSTSTPTCIPTAAPSKVPTAIPTAVPSTSTPTCIPTAAPSKAPTYIPTAAPSTATPTATPTYALSAVPTTTATPSRNYSSLSPSLGSITTIAGTGTASYSGDNGQATSAALYYPSKIALDSLGIS